MTRKVRDFKCLIFFLYLSSFLFNPVLLSAQVKADDIVGFWLTHGDKPAKVQVYRTGDLFAGKIVWLQFPVENGKPKMDEKNPEESKRSQPLVGLVIMSRFKFDNDDEWSDGKIYDPQNGKTYNCYLSLKDKNTLKVRGYIGITLIGRTDYWTRTNFP
jgi:uncharacterized protein (DUF2147 family)